MPTNHVISPLSQAEPPSTVKKLFGWLRVYRQIAKTIPHHVIIILQSFEKLVCGNVQRKESSGPLSLSYCRLVIERQINSQKSDLNGGEFSCRLKGSQSKWTLCEKECLAIKILIHHFQPYIREKEHVITVFSDNIVSVHAWKETKIGKIKSSSRVVSFISTLCKNNIEIVHLPGISTSSRF